MDASTIQTISIWALPVLFAITVHETAHGWIALKLGDRTAQMLGRLTLNPLKHIDPIGTILIPIASFILMGFAIGSAKPVPITVQNLRRPKSDMAWVALAGPAANIIMALAWLIIMKITISFISFDAWIFEPLFRMTQAGVFINIALAIINLFPMPPLDGGRILTSILPNKLSWQVSRIEPYGFMVLIALLVFVPSVLNTIFSLINNITRFLFQLIGI